MNNTIKRAISGIGFILVMLAGLLVNKFLFAALCLFIMSTMLIEFYRITMERKYIFSRILAVFAGDVLFILVFLTVAYGMPARYLGLAMPPIFVVMINSLYVKDKTEFWKFSHIYAGMLYISVPMALANLIAFKQGNFSGLLLLCFFIIIWASDVGAYVIGCTLGKRFGKKLFPSISPKKSWMGFWGGMAFAIIATILLKVVGLFELPMLHCFALGIVMDIAGVYGDLFESQWKRCYDIKDSGTIIPGHGGMLDRFDSSLFAIPMGVIYLVLFNLI